ncbi:MAG: NAD(P)H-binding protein [Neomegalonema sp.]|nr:NAD(P)H-binding protein [Neomegalonema sp.]
MSSPKTALILGASGGVGFETACALRADGWRIWALHRAPERVKSMLPVAEWRRGDAMRQGDVVDAAAGVDVILHAVNPPKYRNWPHLVLPMLENTIVAAKAAGARILLPGAVYNFGPDAFPLLHEGSPQNPLTRKGVIRKQLEARLKQAAEQEDVRTLILRGGDFFGPHNGNSWFANGMVRPGRPVTSLNYFGPLDVGHAWAYLPDFAKTFALLLAKEARLAPFDVFHFGGHWFERGGEMVERVRDAAGAPHAPIRNMPWTAVRLLSPFVRLFRELTEMRYLWTQPVRLDNAKLLAFLGEEPHTEISTTLSRSLRGLGCVPA